MVCRQILELIAWLIGNVVAKSRLLKLCTALSMGLAAALIIAGPVLAGVQSQGSTTTGSVNRPDGNLATTRAGTDPNDPSGRIIKLFDFDERPLGNMEELPMYWTKVRQPGFPHYVKGRLDDKVGYPRKPSFVLELDGGSVGYEFKTRKIAAFPGSDYSVRFNVKSEGLKYARAYLEAFFMDSLGERLGRTAVRSELIGSSKDSQGHWRQIHLQLPYSDPEARFIGLGCYLVQGDLIPRPLQQGSEQVMYKRDLRAKVWIDQIAIVREPKLLLDCQAAGNVFMPGQGISLQVRVLDQVPGQLVGKFTVGNAEGQVINRTAVPVQALPAVYELLNGQARYPSRQVVNLDLAAGAYRAELQVVSERNRVVAQMDLDFLVLGELAAAGRGQEFGISLAVANMDNWGQQLDLALASGAGWVKIPVWRGQLQADPKARDALVDDAIERLSRSGVDVVGCLVQPPKSLAQASGLSGATVWDVLAGKRELWQDWTEALLARHGDQIESWQLGGDQPIVGGTNEGSRSHGQGEAWTRVEKIIPTVVREFHRFQTDFNLIIPWPGHLAMPAKPCQSCQFCLTLPPELKPTAVHEYLESIGAEESTWIGIPLPDMERSDRAAALEKFVKRIIYAKMWGAKRFFIPAPWQTQRAGGKTRIKPGEALLVYRNIVSLLGGGVYIGRINMGGDMEGMAFGVGSKAVVALLGTGKNRWKLPNKDSLSLGDDLVLLDCWGNTLGSGAQRDIGTTEKRSVVFLAGVDSNLARFHAGVHIRPDQMESTLNIHTAELIFSNTFGRTISGRLHVAGPPGWKLGPATTEFTLTDGQELSVPMTVRYPLNESAGQKNLEIKLSISGPGVLDIRSLVPFKLVSKSNKR